MNNGKDTIVENNKYTEPLNLDIVCGKSAAKVIKNLVSDLQINNLSANVRAMENDFFGHEVTVTGLLTGQRYYKKSTKNSTK